METREGLTAAVIVLGAEAPSSFHVAPRTENSSQITCSPAVTVTQGTVGLTGTKEKKKRGRPRKYGPDGVAARALSPTAISFSAPAGGELSTGKLSKVWPGSSEKKQYKKTQLDNSGEWGSGSVGTNFTPHIIIVNAGEGRFEYFLCLVHLSQLKTGEQEADQVG